MLLTLQVLLIVSGVFLIGNAAVSFVASSWAQRFADNWFLAPLANRWGIGRVRMLLVANGVLTGLLGMAAAAVGVYALLNPR